MDLRKRAFLQAYQKAFGNISEGCKAATISRGTYYNWLVNDQTFSQALEAIEPHEDFADFVESALVQRIKKEDTTAIIFAAKTKVKRRGYIERHEITGMEGRKLFEVTIIDDTYKPNSEN